MTRPFVPLLLCAAALALVCAAPAAGQDVKRAPKQLWDEFPLEPSATPSVAPPEATSTARVVRVPDEDDSGMAPGALVALMVAAAGIGAIAARVAARRLSHATPDVAAVPEAEPKPAVEGRPTPTRVPAEQSKPARRRRFQPKARPAVEERPKSVPAAATKPSTPPARAPRPAAKAVPGARRQPSPQAKRAPRPQASPPAASSRTAGRFAPATPRASSACSIELTQRPPMGRFVAVADVGRRVLARSPAFLLKRTDTDTGPTPPEALRTLVEELTAAGWRKTGAGRAPWELRFERHPQDAVTRRASPPRA